MRKFIFGTDWGCDCDDAVALRILARAHKQGKIQLAAVVINHCMQGSVASLEGFLNTEGVYNIPIGIDQAATFGGRQTYQTELIKYAKIHTKNSDAYDAVRLYRKTLAESTQKVEIAEVGFLQAFAALLKSGGDDISDKTGVELVKEKVSKIWVMAGKWDEQGGKEYNFSCNPTVCKASYEFCRLCPVPITFLGWEIGDDVISGSRLAENDVLRKALVSFGAVNGRNSWDPMLAALAVEGNEESAGYDAVCGTARVDEHTGQNFFEKDDNGLHKYVIRKHDAEAYRDMIDELIK